MAVSFPTTGDQYTGTLPAAIVRPFTILFYIGSTDYNNGTFRWGVRFSGASDFRLGTYSAAPAYFRDGSSVNHGTLNTLSTAAPCVLVGDTSGGNTNFSLYNNSQTLNTQLAGGVISLGTTVTVNYSAFTTGGSQLGLVAIWNTNIGTNADFRSMIQSDRFDPLNVHASDLVHYWPMLGNRDIEPDIIGGASLTKVGSPTHIAGVNASIRPYKRRTVFGFSAATGGGYSAVVDQLELADVTTVTGVLDIVASVSQLELADTTTATGSLTIDGSVAQTELADTTTATGSLSVVGTVNQTEVADSQTATSSLTINAVVNQTEVADSTENYGSIVINAVVDQTELPDLVNQTGTISNLISGEANQTELADSTTATSSLSLVANVSHTELPDITDATGSLSLVGTVSQQELADTTTATGTTTISGSASQLELSDSTTATGTTSLLSSIIATIDFQGRGVTQSNLQVNVTSSSLAVQRTGS